MLFAVRLLLVLPCTINYLGGNVIQLFQSATWTFDVVITTAGSVAAVLADLELFFTARSAKAKDKIITAEFGSGITILNEERGIVRVVFTPNDTADMPLGIVSLQLIVQDSVRTEMSAITEAMIVEPIYAP